MVEQDISKFFFFYLFHQKVGIYSRICLGLLIRLKEIMSQKRCLTVECRLQIMSATSFLFDQDATRYMLR